MDRRYIYKFLIFGEKSTFAAKKKTFDANGGGVALDGGNTDDMPGGVALDGGQDHPGCNVAIHTMCLNETGR